MWIIISLVYCFLTLASIIVGNPHTNYQVLAVLFYILYKLDA